MNPEKRNESANNKVKPKKPQFLGWLLPLMIFLGLMAIWGKESFRPEKTISIDEFWYLLISGKVKTPKIEGKVVYIEPLIAKEGATIYKTEFPTLGEKTVEEIQSLSKRVELKITDQKFLEGMQAQTLVPTAAYHVKSENENWGKSEDLFVDLFSATEGARYAHIIPSNTTDRHLPLARIVQELQTRSIPLRSITLPAEGGVSYSDPSSLWSVILLNSLLPFLMVALIIYFFLIRPMRNAGGPGGVLSFGRSRATLYTKENRTNVTFADVAGVDEAKDEVGELIAFLKNPSQFSRLGGRIPRGVLLVGPPGAGKTLLAKAIAGEAEVPFFSISGSDFVEMFVGVGASRVRDLFKQAKDSSPCILFLDEIDAVGRKRGSGMGGGHDEREQTLNAILVEMDGFDTDEGIIVIAATNRPDVLDPALLRPGRFDREIVLDLPDYKGREEVLRVHSRKVKLSPKVDLGVLARSTPTFSGADLAALINEAAIIAVMKKRDAIEMEDLEEARDKIRFGRQKKSRVMQEDDRKITAYHEGGHALVSCLIPEAEKLHKVTIIPRGMALGLTMQLPDRDRYTMGRKRVLADISVAYGGRLAEKLFCADISTGAQNDIKHATQLARYMVTEWGMSDKVGPVNYSEREGSVFLGQDWGGDKFHSQETAREIDQEVRNILNECYERAEKLIDSHRTELEKIGQALLKYETLSGAEVESLIQGGSVDSLRPTDHLQNLPPTDASAKLASVPTNPTRESLPGGLRGNEGLAPA